MDTTSHDTGGEQQVDTNPVVKSTDAALLSQKKRGRTVTRIVTNLPEKLPVLSTETALVSEWPPMGNSVPYANSIAGNPLMQGMTPTVGGGRMKAGHLPEDVMACLQPLIDSLARLVANDNKDIE